MKLQQGYLTEKSGSWLGHYSRWVTDHRTGQTTRQQRAFKIGLVSGLTKTKARAKLRERIVTELGVTADSRATVSWFIDNRWRPLREGTWRESTKAVNKELLKFIIDRFGSTAIEDMDGVQMQAWLADLAKRKSGSLVRHCRIFLRSIMAEAAEQDYVRKNPARLLRVPKLKPVNRAYLDLKQIKALLKAAMFQPRDRTLLTVMFVTALRPSELFALKWKHFDIDHKGTLTIVETIYRGKVRPYTKTTEEGDLDHLTVFVPDAAMIALLKWRSETKHDQPEDYIFPNTEGGYITKENYQKRVLTPLGKAAGIKRVNFQILRRTVATHAQHLGSPKDISVIMRHRKVETAQAHYVQVIEETVKQTTEKLADKMLQR
jgi:integrase